MSAAPQPGVERTITGLTPRLNIVVEESYGFDEHHLVGIYDDDDLFTSAGDRVKRAEGSVLVCLLPGEDVTEVYIDAIDALGVTNALLEARAAIDVAIAMAERLTGAFTTP